MNFLGKLLSVLILIASIGLLTVATMVYATHKNWKTSYDKVKTQLSTASNENQQLQSKKDSLASKLQAEIKAEKQSVINLETERERLIANSSILQKQLDGLLQEQRRNTAAVASTQANNEELTKEVAGLRLALRENQQKRDEAFATTIKATDDLHQAKGKLDSLVERNGQLTQEVAMKSSLLRSNGFDPSTTPGEVVPHVRGLVSGMRRNSSGQLIEVTVGADDGLRKGHTIEIFRGERYLGRAEIMRTEPDRAVGRIIRKFQQGQIQEGDHVATKLRVG